MSHVKLFMIYIDVLIKPWKYSLNNVISKLKNCFFKPILNSVPPKMYICQGIDFMIL